MVHGRGRRKDSLDDTYLGVHEELLYARKTKPVEGVSFLFLSINSKWSLIIRSLTYVLNFLQLKELNGQGLWQLLLLRCWKQAWLRQSFVYRGRGSNCNHGCIVNTDYWILKINWKCLILRNLVFLSYYYNSDPDDRLSPRPVLARFATESFSLIYILLSIFWLGTLNVSTFVSADNYLLKFYSPFFFFRFQ